MLDRGGVVDAALEAVRGIGREVVAARAALDRLRPPERRFQVDVGGVERDRGGVAAHDAGQRFDFALVGDHADPFVDLDRIAVQQLQRFALACPSARRGRRGSCPGRTRATDGPVPASRSWKCRPAPKSAAGRCAPGAASSSPASAARAFRPRITRPEKRPHRSGAEILHRQHFVDALTATGAQVGAFSGAPVSAATSRATPSTDRQSALFGVSLMVNLRSFELVVVADVLADRRVVRQFQQAAVVFRQLQFARRAQHALRLDAAQLADLDFERLAVLARRQHGADHARTAPSCRRAHSAHRRRY